jgi:hypothetical protein
MRTAFAALAFLLCSGAATAQTTAAVSIVQPIQLLVSGSAPATLNVGPVPPAGVSLYSGNPSVVQIEPVATNFGLGAVAWKVLADVRMTTTGPVATGSLSGRVQIVLTTPSACSGVLILMPSFWNSSLSTFTGDLTVDTNCDGVPDWFAATSPHTEVPLVVGPAGTPVWVDFGLGISTNWVGGTTHGGASRTWQVVFVPNVYGVSRYATGCIGGLNYGRAVGSLMPQIDVWDPYQPSPAPTIRAGFLVFGTAPAAIQLPMAPFCMQHVQAMTILAAPPNGWSLSWTLPLAVLPPGLTCFAQVVWLHNNGAVYATDALRTF